MLHNLPVRWGTLGCARVFERRMVPGFANCDGTAVLLGAASRSREKAETVAARHGIERAYGRYEDLLADPEIEAVYIPLPNDQHCEWTLRALDAGKHVLIDKPAALSYAEAVRMADAAKSAGLRLMEGFMYRLHPQHTRLKAIVDSGEIGDPVHFTGTFTYPADPNAANIRWNPEQGGGALLDTGVYPLSAARFVFGTEPVAATAVSILANSGVDRHTIAVLEWADGRTAHILAGFDQTFLSRYEVRGRQGVIRAEKAFQIGEAGVDVAVRIGDGEPRFESFPHVDQYGLEIAHFSRCVRDPALPLAPGEDGAAQARVVEAVIRAARERRRVELGEIAA